MDQAPGIELDEFHVTQARAGTERQGEPGAANIGRIAGDGEHASGAARRQHDCASFDHKAFDPVPRDADRAHNAIFVLQEVCDHATFKNLDAKRRRNVTHG
jgi:hypothetical protein